MPEPFRKTENEAMSNRTVVKRNGEWTLKGERPAPTQFGSALEVKLFEAVRDTYLSLAEWRIALVLGTGSLQEKAAALRAQLISLEACMWKSDAGIGLCIATKGAVAALRQVLANSAPEAADVSTTAKRLCTALSAFSQREPRTDEELRARALAIRARTHMSDDQSRFGIE
jgi:hypothetical protein